MPELPEVEVVKKSLKENICDLTIKNIDIRNKFLRYKIEEKIIRKMIKSKVLSVAEDQNTLSLILIMTAQFLFI